MKTMHYLKTILAIVSAIALCTGFAACSNDDDEENPNVPERETVTTFDDLAYFQDAFIETDSLGKFIAHCVGTPIYENDPTHLYIGVETIHEALEYWDACLAPDITRTTSADNSYNYTLTDKEGQLQGTVSFAPGTESGHVAEITTNATDLKHFKAVTFLLNSAWPFNSEEGTYRLGDVRNIALTDASIQITGAQYNCNFVCVREKSNGVRPLYVGITNVELCPGEEEVSPLLNSVYCPAEAKAKQISELLRKDWELFEACFEEAGGGPLKRGWYYWYDKITWKYLVSFSQGCICLSTGELSDWDFMWHYPKKHVLLKVDWLDD